jgi:EmrB/QacA subfamily drug resistance transporter
MTSAAVDAPERQQTSDGQLSHRQILVILSGLMLGMFLAALDQTIVGTSIRTIADDLHGLSLQAWATTAYLITSTITTPIYGKLSDIYGRRPLFLTAITIFVLGSLACTFSDSMYQLAAFRAVQGLGAGGLMSLAFTIIADLVPPRERAKYQGYFLAVFGTSSVLGPVIGGFFAGQSTILGIAGWRWVFLVNVPVGVVALAVVWKVLHIPHQRTDHRVDYWGALFLTVGLVPLLIIAEQGREWGWDSTRAIVCYVVGVVGIIVFVLVERLMKDEALIPLRLFRSSTFSMVILAGFVVGVGMFGGISMIPQYLQIVKGHTPTEAGLLMLPMMLGIMFASILSGQITSRTGRYKLFPIIGTALLVGGMLLFHTVDVDTPLWQPLVFMGIFGLGLGNCMQTLTIAAQNAVPMKDLGVATASATFFRQMGGTVGVAVFLSVLFSTLPDKIAAAFGRIVPTAGFQAAINDPAVAADPANQPVFQALRGGDDSGGVLSDSSFLQRIDPRLARPFLEGFAESITLVFLSGAGVMVVAFLVTLFIKEIPLRQSAPSQESLAMEGAQALVANEPPTCKEAAEREAAREAAQQQAAQQESTQQETLHDAAEDDSGAFSGSVTPGKHSLAGHAVRGLVRRADGTPVPGAALTLMDDGGGQVDRGTSDREGAFALEAPATGAHVLITSARGHQPQATNVQVGAGAPALNVVLVGTGGVTGLVRAANSGEGLAGARVSLVDERGEVAASTSTDEAGRYLIVEPVSGPCTLVVGATGYRPAAVPLTVPGSGQARLDVDLVGGVELTGVARSRDGRVVPDARITVLNPDGEVVAVVPTGADGRYVLADLPEGEYTVIASGYPPVASRATLVAGDRVLHDVELGHEDEVRS